MLRSLAGRIVGDTLRTRVFSLALAVVIVVGAAGWLAFSHIINHLTGQFGAMIAERQVQYDRHRGMAVLNAELALAESFSRAPAIVAWFKDENDPDLKARGLADMEHYRSAFADGSVFLVVNGSGNYYFNDAQQSYAANPLSYTLDPELERDSWYYATRERREGCYPNVNVDDVLKVTKVWINCLVSENGRVLGMVGTGLDLSGFIRDVVELPGRGIESIFVDQSGAVQAHPDASLVDFRSITKEMAEKQTIFALVDTAEGQRVLRALMDAAREDPNAFISAPMSMGGVERLVGVGYLDHIGWYNVTAMDLGAIIDRKVFWPVAAGTIGVLLSVALVLCIMFRVVVLGRLERVEAGLRSMREGRRASMAPDPSNDEIGRLSHAVIEMSDAITEARLDLEGQVRQRTEVLQSLANLDELTKIHNRRGFEARFATQRRRAGDAQETSGLMLVDIDHFKSINDSAGHAAGDQVVIEVARRLTAALRRVDICARWGGDEFIVLVHGCTAEGLRRVAEALGDMMRQKPIVLGSGERISATISIGATVITGEDTLDVAIGMADAALYSAKDGGRDRAVVFDREATRSIADEVLRPASGQ
ncbi:GGDEF domain-containing protein [Pelagibacterium lacus]|nr:GGDEF domain-containing protein [Pelagibacterium lacus]